MSVDHGRSMSLEDKIRQLDDNVTATVQRFVEQLNERFHHQLESSTADVRQAADQHLQQGIEQLRAIVGQQLHRSQETVSGFLQQLSAELPEWLSPGGSAAELAAQARAEGRREGWLQLRDALAVLDRSTQVEKGRQQQVLAALLEECGHFAERAMLFLLRGEQLVGWGGFGFAAEELAAVRGRALPSTPADAWHVAVEGGSCAALNEEECARLCQSFGATPGIAGVAVPLVLRDRVAALLYADRREVGGTLELAALQVLVWAAAQTIEVLPFRQRSVTGTLLGDQPAAAPVALEARPRPALEEVPVEDVPVEAVAVEDVPVEAVSVEAVSVEDGPAEPAEEVPAIEDGPAEPEPALAAAPEPTFVAEPEVEAVADYEEAVLEAEPVAEVAAAEPEVAAPEAYEPPVYEAPPVEPEPEVVPVVPERLAPAAPPVVLEPEELVARPVDAGDETGELEVATEDSETSKLFDAEPETVTSGTVEPRASEAGPEASPLSTMRWDAGNFQAQLERAGLASAPPSPPAPPPAPVAEEGGALETASAMEFEPPAAPPSPPVPSRDATVLMSRPEIPKPPAPAAPPVVADASEAPTTETPAAEATGGGGLFGGAEASKDGKPVQVAPPQDVEGPGRAFAGPPAASSELDAKRQRARRLARLLVSEIKLYNEEQVEEGRRLGNIYSLLKEDIDRSRQMFNERTDNEVRTGTDFFHEELVRMLAGGDSAVLGI